MRVLFCILIILPIVTFSQGKGRFGTQVGYTFVDWTWEQNWGGSANRWAGYLGFNAFRNDEDPKDYYFGVNVYTGKAVLEGSNYGFRWLYHYEKSNNSEQHKLTEIMRLTNDGFLGIGTSSPKNMLDVNGTIGAHEIKVQAQPADFVFEEDYNLRSLEEVHQFVTENKHLPDIPSAKEMEAEGVGLAEMNKLLLQKVEELTLHMIAQNEKLEAALDRINELEKSQR